MKAVMLFFFCVALSVSAVAQSTGRDYRSVSEIVAIRDTISFDQKIQTAMAIFSAQLPDEVIKTDTGVTLMFRKYNSKITLNKEMYERYCQRVVEDQLVLTSRTKTKVSW